MRWRTCRGYPNIVSLIVPPMVRKRFILPLLVVGGACWFWNHELISERQDRESHFIAVHYLAASAAQENDPHGPTDFDALLAPWGGRGSALGKPFPDGLVYRPRGTSFTLEEPVARLVSLLRKDRLIATERKWPRWESAGDYARKAPGDPVPKQEYE